MSGKTISVSVMDAVALYRLCRAGALAVARDGGSYHQGLDALDDLAGQIREEYGSGILVNAQGEEYPPIRDEIREIEERRIV